MTPEREDLIRSTWASLRAPQIRFLGDTLIVALDRSIRPEPSAADYVPYNPEPYPTLTYCREVVFSEDGSCRRLFVQCEGVIVEEHFERSDGQARRPGGKTRAALTGSDARTLQDEEGK